jgi:tetratricopeptide (TPR) repeat protein
LGRYGDALEAFRKGGGEAAAYNNIGYIYMTDGKYEEAIKTLEKAIEIRPSFYVKANENLKKAKAATNSTTY